jgi:hypothetical protein
MSRKVFKNRIRVQQVDNTVGSYNDLLRSPLACWTVQLMYRRKHGLLWIYDD